MIMDFRTSAVPPLYTDLARSLSGEVDTSYRGVEEHSRDSSPCKISPHIIVYPKTVDDIKKVIAKADEYRIPVSVRGNGRNGSGAALVEGIVINLTKYFNHIKHVDMLGHTINVDPGVNCKKIREHLNTWGMEVPFLTEQNDEDTIGGVVATKNVSPTSFERGPISSWVMGLSVVLSNGEQHSLEDGITPSGKLLSIYQSLFPLLAKEVHNIRGGKPLCSEDNSGYNIWGQSIGPRQLINNIIGSQGTLAIITGIKLRIVPKQAHKITTLIRIPDYQNLPKIIEICKQNGADKMFAYDILLENLSKDHVGHDKEYVASPLPHVMSLVISQSGPDKKALIEKQKRLISELKLSDGYVTNVPEDNQLFLLSESSHVNKLLTVYAGGALIPSMTSSGIIVPIESLGDALTDIENYHNEKHFMYSTTGNVGSGHFSVITLLPNDHNTYPDNVIDTTRECFSIAKKYKGGGSALSGDGMIGTPYLNLFYHPKLMEIFSAIKNIWDPHDILNPGKKISFDISYIKQRIVPLN